MLNKHVKTNSKNTGKYLNGNMKGKAVLLVSGLVLVSSFSAYADETTGFAKCEEYINVRTDASTEADVMGKLYANGKVTILDTSEDGSWYHIRSGNVDGYVAAQYIATGEEADKIAAQAGYTTAEVGAYALNVRSEKSTDSEIVGEVYENNKYEVVEDAGDWVKVVTADGTYGWVSVDYVYTSTEYGTAETLEEEQARLDAAWLSYLASQEDTRAQAEQAAWDAASAAQAEADAAYAAASSAQAQAEADYQAYLEAQSAADNAAADEAAQAQAQAEEAYQAYEASQQAADTASAQSDSAQSAADTAAQTAAETSAAADEYTEEYEDVYEEEEVYDDASSDTSQSSSAAVSSGSSTGAAVASYACQFVGNPYVYGGTSLTGGCDCSGFVMSVYANFGVSLPHNAAAQSAYGTAVDASSLAPGDLVFYGSGISHVAIYIGNGSIVHAANSSSGICYGNLNYSTPVAYRRLV